MSGHLIGSDDPATSTFYHPHQHYHQPQPSTSTSPTLNIFTSGMSMSTSRYSEMLEIPPPRSPPPPYFDDRHLRPPSNQGHDALGHSDVFMDSPLVDPAYQGGRVTQDTTVFPFPLDEKRRTTYEYEEQEEARTGGNESSRDQVQRDDLQEGEEHRESAPLQEGEDATVVVEEHISNAREPGEGMDPESSNIERRDGTENTIQVSHPQQSQDSYQEQEQSRDTMMILQEHEELIGVLEGFGLQFNDEDYPEFPQHLQHNHNLRLSHMQPADRESGLGVVMTNRFGMPVLAPLGPFEEDDSDREDDFVMVGDGRERREVDEDEDDGLGIPSDIPGPGEGDDLEEEFDFDNILRQMSFVPRKPLHSLEREREMSSTPEPPQALADSGVLVIPSPPPPPPHSLPPTPTSPSPSPRLHSNEHERTLSESSDSSDTSSSSSASSTPLPLPNPAFRANPHQLYNDSDILDILLPRPGSSLSSYNDSGSRKPFSLKKEASSSTISLPLHLKGKGQLPSFLQSSSPPSTNATKTSSTDSPSRFSSSSSGSSSSQVSSNSVFSSPAMNSMKKRMKDTFGGGGGKNQSSKSLPHIPLGLSSQLHLPKSFSSLSRTRQGTSAHSRTHSSDEVDGSSSSSNGLLLHALQRSTSSGSSNSAGKEQSQSQWKGFWLSKRGQVVGRDERRRGSEDSDSVRGRESVEDRHYSINGGRETPPMWMMRSRSRSGMREDPEELVSFLEF
ncbi:hypothetical protein ABKN59_004839 [Abortiporus biennis]